MTTKAKATKVAAKYEAMYNVPLEVDSETVTVWYGDAGYDAAKAAADAIAADLKAPHVGYYGGKFLVYYKKAPVDRGDYNDPTSKWHY